MQKIYVLLRQDQQTGPYSLEELIQFDLKPYDLIWIEGKSAGWYYPQEIAALHPYLNFLPQKPKPVSPSPEKKLFVASPAAKESTPILPPPALTAETPKEAYKPSEQDLKNLEAAVYAQFKEPAAKKEPDFGSSISSGIPSSGTQRKKSPSSVGVALTAVLIIGGVFTASWIMNRQPDKEDTVKEATINAPVQDEITTTAVAYDDNTRKEQGSSAPRQQQQKSTTPTTGAAKQNAPQKRAQEPLLNQPETAEYERPTPTRTQEQTPASEIPASTEESADAPQEKKKKLRDKIFDFFKKKPEENKPEESRSSEKENNANLMQMVHVRFDIPHDWMMGIKGAKATLVNRSNEKIRNATVEVLYYNDADELLQKKVITFGKMDEKETQTISIPDHSLATKVDYTILSITGANQPPA